MEMVGSMLKAKHLPNEYWEIIVPCAIYIMNRCPIRSVSDMVKEEAWTGRNHSVSHMRVFVCMAHIHVSDE